MAAQGMCWLHGREFSRVGDHEQHKSLSREPVRNLISCFGNYLKSKKVECEQRFCCSYAEIGVLFFSVKSENMLNTQASL